MFQNQNPAISTLNAGSSGGGGGEGTTPNESTQQSPANYNGMSQDPHSNQQHQKTQQQQSGANNSKSVRKKPYVKITEQPAGKALRFRYECEGRSAGSIPGVNSTQENKTYPTIEIVGYKGRAVVVVSCVTKDSPYRPHPHNLVGKEGCKKGVCTLEINSETMRAVFSNLGIQCVKKKDIEAALKAREEIRVDPFKTGFSHRFQPSSIDLNSVRLCFQVFMESERASEKGRFTQPLSPVVSEPIYDKKAMSDLVICRLCSFSASVLGNTQIILLCEKVAKEDITVRFFEEKNGDVWEAYGEFQHTDVHKQTAITFKTPRYHSLDITEPAKVFIQLKRPSDGVTSEPLPFEYIPLDSGRHTFWNIRRNLKRKPDLDIFQQILAVDREAKRLDCEPGIEVIDLNTPTAPEQSAHQNFGAAVAPTAVLATASPTESATVIHEDDEAAKRRNEHEIDTIIDEKVRELEQQHQQQQQQQQQQHEPQLQAFTTVDSINTLAGDQYLLPDPHQLSANDKITEWMKSNELQQMETQNIGSTPISLTEEDKTLNELLEQVAELDEIYTDHLLRRDTYNNTLLNELNGMDSCIPDSATAIVDGGQTAMEVDEHFDDAATYTSLQIAFKNPIVIPMTDIMPPTPPASHLAPEDTQHYDHVELMTHPNNAAAATTATAGEISNLPQPSSHQRPSQQSPPRPPVPPKSVGSPPCMHVTAAEEEKSPPPLPKRTRKQTPNDGRGMATDFSGDQSDSPNRSQAPILIIKSPDQSPPTKRLPPKPNNSKFNTLPRQKKPGFFSKLFSRRKSKGELSKQQSNEPSSSQANSKTTSPNTSREPSIGHFDMHDPNRSSIRSVKSLQPGSLPSSPTKKSQNKSLRSGGGKPVGRSVSSVSGKRPAHLNADVIHIPLKGDSTGSLTHPGQEAYSNASTLTLGHTLDRRTVSALQLANIPISDGNMELVAIADRQSLRNLCGGEFNIQLDPNVDLTEAEHFALYTSIPPQATVSEFDETSAYYAPVDAGEILTPEEIAKRLAVVNRNN